MIFTPFLIPDLEKKKERKKRVGLGLGFPKIAGTILREQSFRLKNREEKTKVPVPVPENENGKIMVINSYDQLKQNSTLKNNYHIFVTVHI
jgi:hypothetical protein